MLYADEDQEVGIESVMVNDANYNITLGKYFQQEILSLRIVTMQGGAVWLHTWLSTIFPDASMIEDETINMSAASELLFSGFPNDINAALSQLRYKGPKDLWGKDVDKISISLYQGIDVFGGGAVTFVMSCSIAVHLSPVNDPPQISNPLLLAPSSVYDVEDGGQRWGWVTVEGLSVSDVDDENLHVKLSAICAGCIAELWLPLNVSGSGKLHVTTLWPENEEEDMCALSGSVIEVEGSTTDINLALSAMLFSGPPSLGTGIAIQVKDKAEASSFLFIPYEIPAAEEMIRKNLPKIHAAVSSVAVGSSLQLSHFVDIIQGEALSLGSEAGLEVDNDVSTQDGVALQNIPTMRTMVQFRHGAILEIQSVVTSVTSTYQLGGSFSISIGADEVDCSLSPSLSLSLYIYICIYIISTVNLPPCVSLPFVLVEMYLTCILPPGLVFCTVQCNRD